MKPDNQFLFFGREALMLEIWPQVISPSKPATLTTSSKPYKKTLLIYSSKLKDIVLAKECYGTS